jgi:hypothetical protein
MSFMLSVSNMLLMLSVVMLIVIYAECLKYALNAECHYAECRYAECCGANSASSKLYYSHAILS